MKPFRAHDQGVTLRKNSPAWAVHSLRSTYMVLHVLSCSSQVQAGALGLAFPYIAGPALPFGLVHTADYI